MLWWTLQRLKSSKQNVKTRAARSLGAAKQKKAVPSLIAALEDESLQVRIAVIEALGAIGHPASAEPLASALANLSRTARSHASRSNQHPETAEYEALAKALAGVGPAAAVPLLRMLESDEREPRRWASYALGLLKDPQAVGPLIEKLEDSRSEVRKAAALALGRIGDSRALKGLFKALTNRDWETRRTAAEALGAIGSEDAVDALAAAAENQSEPVQLAAINGLEKIGGLRAAACLRSAMTGARKAVCVAAETALKSMKLSAANAGERAEWAAIIGDFDAAFREGTAAVPAMIKALGYKDPQMRRQAAVILARLRSREAVPHLLQTLKDHHPAVQEAAAHALAAAGSAALEGLQASLTYYDASVVRLAAGALGKIGDSQAAPALIELIAGNRSVSSEYPEMLEAIDAAVDSLGAILASSPSKISQQDLQRITELPEAIHLIGPQPLKSVDCVSIRNLAGQELARRSSP